MSKRLNNPELFIQRIQAGDSDLREQFITDSIPFVKSAVRHITHSFYVDQEDEYSIALEAYNQAITRFKVGGEVPFEPYALLLIKNRLLNWIRDQKQARQVLTMTDCESDDGIDLADRLADPKSGQIQQNLEFEEAMLLLELQLKKFGLSMIGLSGRLPRHQDTRRLCIRAANQLAKDDSLYKKMMQKQKVPCVELARRCEIPVKTIEKNRSGIILFTLLLKSELDVIRSYIAAFGEGSK